MASISRIVFFGTPSFALPALEALVAAGRAPALVVSQPARPAGRGRALTDPPVAVRARELGLELVQPASVRNPEFLAEMGRLAADLAIVVAFGQIFPRALLDLPRSGCINVHASLLPRWRGAAPIQAAIAAGDVETGVAIQRMEEGLDTGPLLAERRTSISVEDTAGEISARLAELGAELLLEVVAGLESGSVVESPQSAAGVTYAPKLVGARQLDLALPATELERMVRAFVPEPGAFLVLRGERIKLLGVRALSSAAGTALAPGTVTAVGGESLAIAAGDGTQLELRRVQRPGRRPISGRDLANGLHLGLGDLWT